MIYDIYIYIHIHLRERPIMNCPDFQVGAEILALNGINTERGRW